MVENQEGASPTASYIESVRDILFAGQAELSEADHIEVVRRSMGSELDGAQRRLVYDYARSNIREPNMLTNSLIFIAGKAVEGIEYSTHPYDNVVKSNKQRFKEARALLGQILSGSSNFEPQTLENGFRLLLSVEDTFKRRKNLAGYDAYSGIFGLENEEVWKKSKPAKQEFADIGLDLLNLIRERTTPETRTVGGFKDYLQQIEFAEKGPVSDRIIEAAIEIADETESNPVKSVLDLMIKTDDPAISQKILDKAYELTVNADREGGVYTTFEEQRSRLPFVRVKRIPVEHQRISPFESRLLVLTSVMGDGPYAMQQAINKKPDHVKRVVELHTPERQAELWQSYAKAVADFAFNNGSYRIDRITTVMDLVDQFGEVAPTTYAELARERVKQRLAKSAPSIKKY